MRLIHTADWHLGQTFGGFSRDAEHRLFLAWLLDRVEDERADALLVCGDVFDTGNAPATAQALYYGFLAELRRRFPALDVVVIGGNHDAAPRLDAPGPVLRSLRVHVVGALPRDADGAMAPHGCAVPLLGPSRDVEAWCAAVPFLRMADLPLAVSGDDPVVAGVRDAYGRVLDNVRERASKGALPIVALGHCHMSGASLTDDSERPVFGNAHPLPADIFPDDVAYAALGHLHFAQAVGGRENVRYSGSPIPLSMTERAYKHQVLVVDVDKSAPARVKPLFVPRSVELLRVPERAVDLKEALEALRLLEVAPAAPDAVEDRRPFLEVRVKLDAPCPDLRTQVENALEKKDVRLVRVHRELAGDGAAFADTVAAASSLAEIEPVVVLERLYERTYGGDVPDDIRGAFHELLEGLVASANNASSLPAAPLLPFVVEEPA